MEDEPDPGRRNDNVPVMPGCKEPLPTERDGAILAATIHGLPRESGLR